MVSDVRSAEPIGVCFLCPIDRVCFVAVFKIRASSGTTGVKYNVPRSSRIHFRDFTVC